MLLQAKYQCKSENNCLLTLYDIITKSDQNIYENVLPCTGRQNRSTLVIQSRKNDPYLSCIYDVFENKDCLTIYYLVTEMYS